MWISRLLVRWYRSCNTRFEPVGGKPHSRIRPWENYEGEFFPFVEIPLDRRITTIVGANESGKSHLLSALGKVFTGHGNGEQEKQAYSKQDICRYCAFEELERNVWPCLAVEVTFADEDEFKAFLSKAKITAPVQPTGTQSSSTFLTFIIDGARSDDKYVAVYGAADAHLGDISKAAWTTLGENHFPAYKYIDARLELSNEVHVSQLLAMYKKASPSPAYDPLVLQTLADTLVGLAPVEGQPVKKEAVTAYNDAVSKLKESILGPSSSAVLEMKLFHDVLEVPEAVLAELASLGASDRGYVERRISEINHRLNERLDITHFWQQDDAFRLEVVFKSGFFYFEITDRTGAKYTFNERSSGLRFFLSYYIQAKAIEKANEERGSFVVMDEPDGFLSVAGQRNLLRIFDSLVSPKQSSGTCQLVYTTHSPFLINRNFPQRIRLVRKGDGSEGTQYVPGSSTRRHEPIRSALGIDCSETLFMGAVNIVVEGASDQKVIVGGIQKFGDASAVDDLLDLNKVTFVSAGGVGHVRRLVEQTDSGDDKRPIVVVLLDGDAPGSNAYQEIVANDVLGREFITTLDQAGLAVTWNSSPRILEDIVPPKLLANAVVGYLKRRWGETVADADALACLTDSALGDDVAKRFVAFTKSKLGSSKDFVSDLDIKSGVLDQFVESLLEQPDSSGDEDVKAFEKNIRAVCGKLQAMIDTAEGQARKDLMHKCVRLIEERFRKSHTHAATKADIERFIRRFEGECGGPSAEARNARENLVELRTLLDQETAGASDAIDISAWKRRFHSFRERPWKRPDQGWK